MALSVLVVLLLAILYEGIKVGKAKLLYHTLAKLHTPASQDLILAREQDSADSDSLSLSRTSFRYRHWLWGMGRVLMSPCEVGWTWRALVPDRKENRGPGKDQNWPQWVVSKVNYS